MASGATRALLGSRRRKADFRPAPQWGATVSSWIPDGSKVADAPRAVTNDEALEVNFTPTLMTNCNLTVNLLPAVGFMKVVIA